MNNIVIVKWNSIVQLADSRVLCAFLFLYFLCFCVGSLMNSVIISVEVLRSESDQ